MCRNSAGRTGRGYDEVDDGLGWLEEGMLLNVMEKWWMVGHLDGIRLWRG